MYVAGNDGNGDLDKYARPGDSTFFGGTYPALTWAEYMKTATKGQAVKEFPGPAYVNREELPQPEQTMQETQVPTDQPQTRSAQAEANPNLELAARLDGTKRFGDEDQQGSWRRQAASALADGNCRAGLRPAAGVEQSPGRDRRPIGSESAIGDRSFVGRVSQRIGGPLGRYAATGSAWWNPLRVTLLVGTLVYLSGVVFRLPCRITVAGQPPPDHFKYLCYSDIGLLYAGRGLLQGHTPYLDSGDYPVLEYPVLTGWFLELERLITRVLGGLQGTGLTDQQRVDSTLIFVDVNTVLLGALFLVALWAMVRTPVGRPWDAMMLAASPCVAAAALINWDMLPIALTALGMACWSARRPGLTGVMLGLGAAAKLYPALLLGPLFLLCLRAKRMGRLRDDLVHLPGELGIGQLPVLLLAPDAWRSFWQYNSERGGDLGSIWYVLSLAGHPVPYLNWVSGGLFALCCMGILILIMYAPHAAAVRCHGVPGRRGIPDDQQGLFTAVRALAAALDDLGPTEVA